jgi:hypothetical protein
MVSGTTLLPRGRQTDDAVIRAQALSYDEMTRIGKEAGERFSRWPAAVSDDDRAKLMERFGVDPRTHEIFRAPLEAWRSTFVVGSSTFVWVGGNETVWFSPMRGEPLPNDLSHGGS